MEGKTSFPGTIGNYEVVRVVGKGGMGTVYHCIDPRLNRMVAVKVLSADKDARSTRSIAGRFLREAMTTARLQHPGIPPVYEFGRDGDGRDFYAMKYIDGVSLAAVLARQGNFILCIALIYNNL